ncbi:MAG: PL29 family lyase N-terminal domain-containing protein [Bacteroidales bacterium]|nr:PL29 family lyase N-terminal domain-containing protein [Bacteroidales bacterium]
MKKVFLTLLAAASLCACNGDLKDRVDTLETKVAALESKVNENVSSIAKLADAAAKAVTIESVTQNEDKTSYTIKFSDGQTAVLTNGKDAEAPVVGMKEFEGELYWTVNGEFMTNNGAKVPVSGKTPQFKIQDGKWYVSYDGKAWDEVPVSGTVEPKLEMTETETEYVFTLGETVIKIVKEKAFAIKVKADSRMVVSGQVVTIGYTLFGADATTHVVAESKGLEAEVDEASSTVKITVPKTISADAYVIVKAVRNSDGKYSAQYISFTQGETYGTFGGVIVKDGNEYLNW